MIKSHFFGMARTGNHKNLIPVAAETVGHVVRNQYIIIGYNTLYGRHYRLGAQIDINFVRMCLEVRRRHRQQQRVTPAAHLVNVAGEVYAIDIEGDIAKICRIAAFAYELFDTVVTAHVPMYGLTVLQQ